MNTQLMTRVSLLLTLHLHLPGYVRLRNYSKTRTQRLSMPRFQNDMTRKDGDEVVSQSRGSS